MHFCFYCVSFCFLLPRSVIGRKECRILVCIFTNVACVGHPVSTAKLAEPMEMLFGGQTHVGPNNHVLDWGIVCMGVKLICVLVSCKTKYRGLIG